MNRPERTAVDDYLRSMIVAPDALLESVLLNNATAGLPPHDVSPHQGKLLHLLARIGGARRILELGTLGGYSTIRLARALPVDGHLVTLVE
jgi:predicted O-methyltransferase YrrM